MLQFVRLVPGDLELVETPNNPFGSPVDPNDKYTDHNTVKIVDTIKTTRFYNGPNAAKVKTIATLASFRSLVFARNGTPIWHYSLEYGM